VDKCRGFSGANKEKERGRGKGIKLRRRGTLSFISSRLTTP
jgi:hypothetical protein